MNRRQLLTALGGLGLTGASVAAFRGDLPGIGGDDSGLPMRLETLDARGSEAGETAIPVPETPTVIDLFATWCAPCKEQMNELSTVYEEYGDSVAFVSVTNERIGGTLSADDIRAWWRRHHGEWTVALDPDSDLMAALGAGGIPYLVVTDAAGTIRWQDAGLTRAPDLRTELDAVLAET